MSLHAHRIGIGAIVGVDLDVTEHEHGPFMTHTHPGGSIPHDHLMRAVCIDPRCDGFEPHNIHPLPGNIEDGQKILEN